MIVKDAFFGIWLLLLGCAAAGAAHAQDIDYGISAQTADALPDGAIASLAERALDVYAGDESLDGAMNRARLEIAAGRFEEAAATILVIRGQLLIAPGERWAPYQVYADARARMADSGGSFEDAYGDAFEDYAAALDDLSAERTFYWFAANVGAAKASVDRLLAAHVGAKTITLEDAFRLIRAYVFYAVYAESMPLSDAAIAADRERRYIIEDILIPTPGGAHLSAFVVRPRSAEGPLPTALRFSIYADDAGNRAMAIPAAAHGYASMVVNARGKRQSADKIVPYEVEAGDTTAAIDWASRRSFSDGQVGMYGGSYDGFAAWAAAKRLHPALKTIAAYAAHIPGQGLPMENNVFLNANYGWAFFVTNNRTLDYETYNDPNRWAALNENWYQSGRPYREIDQVDGTPNPWLQRWLKHPSYDKYWQAMVPYGEDFSHIDIPVLTITGYYDDGQISAVRYLREHYRYNPDAEHYLVIGPYDHLGAQNAGKPGVLRGYQIDEAAQFDTVELTFAWFDYVMRGATKPEMLQDRINYEVMGADRWRHAPSLAAMAEESWTLYLSDAGEDGRYRISPERPETPGAIRQTVDFADRTTTSANYYPDPIVDGAPDFSHGLVFQTEPLDAPIEINGAFSGVMDVVINKRDFDFMVALYELRPDGSAMELSYYVGRASYAKDISKRKLLKPGTATHIPFERSYMVSRRVEAGSRLVLIVDVIKDGFHQINYGTGGDVSDESIADAGEPLIVEWRNDSIVRIPVRRLATE